MITSNSTTTMVTVLRVCIRAITVLALLAAMKNNK